jgi:hypothetical protein
MLRRSRARKENTAYAATFVSLIALVACGGSSDAGDRATETDTPGLQGDGTTDSNGTGTPGTTPAGTDTATPGATPSGEGNPVLGGPLAPPGTEPGGTTPPGTEPTPGLEPGAFVENNGEACVIPPLPAFADLQTLTTLPDPFLGLNGERITSKSQWQCRREEIRQLGETFIYGPKPGKPESVTGTVSATSITVNVSNQGRTASFTAAITMPTGTTGPVPVVIGYGGSSFQAAINAEGVAFINYPVDTVGDETTRNPKVGAFYTVNPDRQDTGMLLAWAWGVSRMIDVIEASGAEFINPRGVGVHGCSRSGKGAFIAGAFDERVALTIPLESGMSGVAAFRYVVPEGGEVLRNAIEYRPWAGTQYQQFLVLGAPQTDPAALTAQNVASGELQNRLPIDTHEVIGMIAPRGLLVMGNPAIVNLAPRAEQIAVLAGAEIYSALGVAENLSYVSNTQNGTHCSFRQEYVPALQANLRKFLKGDATATTGTLDPDPRLTGQLAPNVAWETPTLQ